MEKIFNTVNMDVEIERGDEKLWKKFLKNDYCALISRDADGHYSISVHPFNVDCDELPKYSKKDTDSSKILAVIKEVEKLPSLSATPTKKRLSRLSYKKPKNRKRNYNYSY